MSFYETEPFPVPKKKLAIFTACFFSSPIKGDDPTRLELVIVWASPSPQPAPWSLSPSASDEKHRADEEDEKDEINILCS